MTDPSSRQEPSLRLRAGELASRQFEDETVVLDLKSSMYLSTNAAGTLIWQALERGTTRTQLVELLLREFDVERAQAEADVDAFLSECRKRKLLSEPS
jgi:hypothetical protein